MWIRIRSRAGAFRQNLKYGMNRLGYELREEYSDPDTFVFVKKITIREGHTERGGL